MVEMLHLLVTEDKIAGKRLTLNPAISHQTRLVDVLFPWIIGQDGRYQC